VELEARPALSARERSTLALALTGAGIPLDGTPAAYRAPWRRAGLAEATGVADGSGALAAEDAGGDARVVEA
jgi:hypothetical protein